MDAAQLAQFVADADISLVTQSKMAEIIDDIRGGVLGGETLDAVFALFKGQLQLTESDRRAIGEFLAVAAKSLMEAGVDSDAIGWVLEMARNEIGDVPFHATGGSVAFFAGGGVYGSEINGLSRAGYIALFALVAASAKESVLLTFSGDLGRPESISLWIGAGTATFRAVDVPPEDGGGSLAARRVQSWSSIGSDGVSVGESDGGKILEIAR
ncbi:MAG: hypothetical protein LBI39_04080 [Puniceicoccales bacterium]|nr:hypothetical protein [Puniceicoccales bacterium]